MSELIIDKNSIQNAILKDGQIVSGVISNTENNSSINSSGTAAVAIGYATANCSINATNIAAVAIGGGFDGDGEKIIEASGQCSFAGGKIYDAGKILAKESGSFAHGQVASGGVLNASGLGSFVHGQSAHISKSDPKQPSIIQTRSNGAHAEGFADYGGIIDASGFGSYAGGCASTGVIQAYGNGAHAEGFAYDGSIKAIGNGAHAEGFNTQALGNGAHAEGYETLVYGEGSHVEGYLAKISNTKNVNPYGAHAEGIETEAQEIAAHAEGSGTIASGFASHAEGIETVASGNGAHAEGGYYDDEADITYPGGEASGQGTHAGGIGTIANQEAMTSIGKYNVAGAAGDLFIVGGGLSDSSRYNAFKVNSDNDKKVTVIIGDYITMQSYKDKNNRANGLIQAEENLTVVADGLNIQGNGSPINIYGYDIINVNCDVSINGEVHASKGFYDESDIRKKDILSTISLEKSYELLDKCQEIIYTLKENPNKKEQIGMIAQEVEEFFPEIVSTDNNGFKSLDYARLSVICLRLIKDIVEQIKELKNEIKNLKN